MYYMYQSFLECYFPIKLIKTFSFLEVSCNLNVIQLTLSRYAKNLPALLQITVEQSSVEQTKGENSFDLAIRKKYEFFFSRMYFCLFNSAFFLNSAFFSQLIWNEKKLVWFWLYEAELEIIRLQQKSLLIWRALRTEQGYGWVVLRLEPWTLDRPNQPLGWRLQFIVLIE